MNLEAIEKRMNEIAGLIDSANDLDSLKELRKEYDDLSEKRNAILETRKSVVKVSSTVNEIKSTNPVIPTEVKNTDEKRTEDIYGTLEYRMAFKDYAQKGIKIPAELRAGGATGTTVTGDVGAIIPTTIMNEFIKDVSKVYGQMYSKVRKLNIKGGVKFPISALKANFKWITETEPSGKQKAGDIKTFVEFSYHMGEIRIATTLLANIVTLDVFESEIVRILVEAYVKAMDEAIVSGSGTGQPLGITKDPRVKQVVKFKAKDMADWTTWRKNLFAKIPLSKRGKGEFFFAPATVEVYLQTLKDANNRPLFQEATNGSMGNLGGSFYGHSVTLVEPELIKDYDTALNDEVFGIYAVMDDYAINTNMEMTYRRYFDEDTNEWIDKALVVVDGKVLDPSGFYLLKKDTTV